MINIEMNKTKTIIKKEKGAISIFVLVGLLFMSAFLIITYAYNINKSKVVDEQFDIISEIYSRSANIEESYTDAYTDLRSKNKQTLTATSENSEDTATLELTRTFGGNLSNYKIYGKGNFVENHNLPTEYQEVEYIESTGTQYIDTGIYMDTSIKIDLTMQLNYTDKDQKFLGSYGSGGICLGTYAGKWRLGNSMWAVNENAVTLEKVNIQAYNDNWYINGVNVATTKFSANNQAPISLFGIFYNGSLFQRDSIKVYSLKIYDGDTAVREFIPCYRKSDNIIGMYDLVNGKFYTNSGTEEFIKGEAVEVLEGVGGVGGVGDFVSDANNVNSGKYKISIKSSKNEGESIVKDIYINEPLQDNEYLDYSLGKIVRNDGTEESIELPEISTYEDYTKIELITEVKPLKIEVEYIGYTI